MTADDQPIDRVLDALRERAKELQCLYRVDEALARSEAPLDQVFREVIEAIPPGWQYPAVCWARILHRGDVYQPHGAVETPWAQGTPIAVQGEPVGRVEVFYTREMPAASEGPFLKEERKLIDTIAARIGHALTERALRATLRERGPEPGAPPSRREWDVVIDFLRRTDPRLLGRIARRMLNHLSRQGNPEAQRLVELASGGRLAAAAAADANQPARRTPIDIESQSERIFDLAARQVGDVELVAITQRWLRDDRASFLLEALENPGLALEQLADALVRFRQLEIDERELSRPTLLALRVGLIRRLLSDEPGFVEIAKHHLEVEDFIELVPHIISSSGGHGKLGGKSAGLILSRRILARSTEYADLLQEIRTPRTKYLTSDTIQAFLEFNQLQDAYDHRYLELDQIRREYPHIVQTFKRSAFPPDIARDLQAALDDFGEVPLVVRSSSLLEDRFGAAFSGKYKSLFLANRGSRAERLDALMDAVAEVYASVLGPDPIEYRAERHLLDVHEEMGVMIQEVVGRRVGRWFLPAYAGVAFSTNEFRWSPRIRREDGLLRLVPGLGTRAVDRLPDDYPVLVAPGQPTLRANAALDEVLRYAPRYVDALNLVERRFETIEVRRLLREAGAEMPALAQIVSVLEDQRLRRLTPLDDLGRIEAIVSFQGLLTTTTFVQQMRALLRVLEDRIGAPVDVEFASDGRELYILQCRPQSAAVVDAAPAIPRDIPRERVIFTARRFVSNATLGDLTHIVYVDAAAYAAAGEADMRRAAQTIGRLNRLLPRKKFILIGPGRWGSRGDIRLGVPVGYADISNTAALVEVARRRGDYVPDLSFGTHFFQDLVESDIRYVPLFPDEANTVFNERFLRGAANSLARLLPDAADLADLVRLIDVPRETGGLPLAVLMNAELDEAIAFIAERPGLAATAPRAAPVEPDHWRWRLRMAQRIAADVDRERFGIKAIYLFGSTKNATAGPGSDIDLLIHVGESPGQRRALELWLDGWSRCLAELNFTRTGYRSEGLLDVHFITDADIAARTSYAARIDAITDRARPLPPGGDRP
jgi:hypothetical protein